ncbi:MAG: T9SS C-terminal target domain-containing protein [Bacteroidetes bacterium]|nr:T9SS C-terminal target domain-containing protein [Bacteroidota bacterium]
MMRKYFLLTLACALFQLHSNAQTVVPCATDEIHQQILEQHPELKMQEQLMNETARRFVPQLNKAATIKYIPVVFHVIHGYGNENISQAQINDQIRILNEDYRKVAGTNGGSSTDPLAVDMEYEFRLAQFDPNGNPTDGVNRVNNYALSINATDNTKASIYWPSDKYFNIWVVNTILNNTGSQNSIVLGYAQFPSDRTSRPTTDGVIIRSDQVGVIGTGQQSQAGRTLTHEAGHWVGLYHPFQGACGSSSSNCAVQGDQVCDTPPVASSASGCQTGRNSCSTDNPDLPDLIRNYMDYSDGNCDNMFTKGQKTRADGIMPSTRGNIYSAANLSNIGLNTDGTYKTIPASSKKAPFNFDFNVSSLNGTGWFTEAFTIQPDTAWQINQAIGYNDSKSIYNRNFLTQKLNTRSSFSSPSYDISGLTSPKLTFAIAYAKRISASNDKLTIYVSNNYGRTEEVLKTLIATDMTTVDVTASEFVPANASQWKKLSYDLSAYKSYTNLSVRFEFMNVRGNNIFLDDISVAEPTGSEELLKESLGFIFFPNPVNQTAQIKFNLSNSENVSINLFDISGRLVKTLADANMPAGANSVNFDKAELNKGVYFLKVETSNGSFSHKVMID